LETPQPFWGISLHYIDFHQIPDEEVIRILEAQEPKEAKKAKGAKTKRVRKAKQPKKTNEAKTAGALPDHPV
jgi:topoisomerase IA-like protein